jgi:hypothetical protein
MQSTLYLHRIASITVSPVESRGSPSSVPALSMEYWVRDIIIRDETGTELAIHVFSTSGPQALAFEGLETGTESPGEALPPAPDATPTHATPATEEQV